ncbi:MAG: sulfur carrier protein ThiS [Candidatus Saganbacteria bacterium]|nr:sulfur carrier protein ThiS [Candidatus Saganbacteria bacterium]
MKIIVNGEEKETPRSVNIRYLASMHKLDSARAVIEHNGKILKGEEWGKTYLNENDKIEIISFVGGG